MNGLWLVWPSLITVVVIALVSQTDNVLWVEGEGPPPRRTLLQWWDDLTFAAIICAALWLYTLAVRLLP